MIKLPKLTLMAAALLAAPVFSAAAHASNPDKHAPKKQQTPATERVDPAYSRTEVTPAPDTLPGVPWLYGDTELEAWRLKGMRALVGEAKLRVRYPGNYYEPKNRIWFRIPASEKGRGEIALYAYGNVRVTAGGETIYTAADQTAPHHVRLPQTGEIMIALTTAQEPPAMRIDKGLYATTNPLWRASADSATWNYPCAYPQRRDGVLPHRAETPTIRLKPVAQNDTVYDFGRELFGFLILQADKKPLLHGGESLREACDTVSLPREQSFALEPAGEGCWRTVTPVAFRYAYVPSAVESVECDTYTYPARYVGDFTSADPLLDDIWEKSAYTLRLCMHEFLIDGIKRDRLPWAGDLAMSMMANAYTFADREIVRRTIAMLGREGIHQTDINDIADYSLWWLIAQDRYQLFFGDRLHLKREWPRICKALDVLESRCDKRGFVTDSIRWLFIDWMDIEKENALQVLWWWAQRSAVALAERMGDNEMVSYWEAKSDKLKTELLAQGYDPQRQAWRGKPDGTSKPNRHANFLAVISGLAPASQYPGILSTLADTTVTAVGTPYMAGFEYMALTRMGASDRMLQQMKDYWGGMIRQGATSFWEGYGANEDEVQQYMFYRRPYGKSLCHAWSSGPAALIPSELLGIRPVADGWKTFEVVPQVPRSMQPLQAVIPTPQGEIRANVRDGMIRVEIPQGCTARFRGKDYTAGTPIEAAL